jgi:hypothetical protein
MVCDPKRTFYVELQPVNNNYRPSALSISGLSMEKLAQQGLPPAEAMARFETWTKEQVPEGQRPIFVAFNAPFDWMFVNDYFHRYIGHNPFGHNALLGRDRDASRLRPLQRYPQADAPRPPRRRGSGRALSKHAQRGRLL